MPAIVRLDHVSKRFIVHHERPRSLKELMVQAFRRRDSSREELWALRDVGFEVEAGETLGIIGPNGSGKSTILKLIARILEPTTGEVSVNARVSALLELGAGFHPDLTGRENIYLNGSILGLSRREIAEKFDAIVDFSELARFIDMPVKHYSSGMYVRLGFAVAINVEADILLVDEVLAVGDEAFRPKCWNKIMEHKSRGRTILFVSHALDTVETLCDRALLLHGGRVVADGDPRDVIYEYRRLTGDARYSRQQAGPSEEGETIEEVMDSLPTRWGSGEIQFTEVKLLDGEGRERRVFETGETMVVRLGYRATVPVRDPLFQVQIWNGNVMCHGTNTGRRGIHTGEIRGSGAFEIRYDPLDLLGSSYFLRVAILPSRFHQNEPYDKLEMACPFEVRSSWPQGGGLMALDHQWSWVEK